ncbi:hypothetical protein ACS0TY_003564 [Phlomoides rotata]
MQEFKILERVKKYAPTSRRVWTHGEEKELVNALRELVIRGLKCDNGFKSRYLNLLENSLARLNNTTYHIDALPEVWVAYIKADPTAHGLKNKTFHFYNDWLEIFGNDRVMGADSRAHVDAEQDIVNQTSKHNASSADIDQSGEISPTKEFTTADPVSVTVNESSSATKDKGKSLKRKQLDNLESQFIDIIGNYCDKSDSRFGQIAVTMGSIA